jgi:hypothetical protein
VAVNPSYARKPRSRLLRPTSRDAITRRVGASASRRSTRRLRFAFDRLRTRESRSGAIAAVPPLGADMH